MHTQYNFLFQEAERKQEEERIRMENILSGNPLLNYSAVGQKNDLKVFTYLLLSNLSGFVS